MNMLALATVSFALLTPAAFAQTAGGGAASASPTSSGAAPSTSGVSTGSTSSGTTATSGKTKSKAQEMTDPLNPLNPQTNY